jgi:hypothetical protein
MPNQNPIKVNTGHALDRTPTLALLRLPVISGWIAQDAGDWTESQLYSQPQSQSDYARFGLFVP